MNHKIIVTDDNSKSLLNTQIKDTYHSSHGAITESMHIYIDHGISKMVDHNSCKVFEMGFGTGLNSLLTYIYSIQNSVPIEYHTCEKFPIPIETIRQLEYPLSLKVEQLTRDFEMMHEVESNFELKLKLFAFKKILSDFQLIKTPNNYYDICYYDAFGPSYQNELWNIDSLQKVHQLLKPEGFLITYCSQGQFKRHLKSLGFTVESLPGPKGKREITRAFKM